MCDLFPWGGQASTVCPIQYLEMANQDTTGMHRLLQMSIACYRKAQVATGEVSTASYCHNNNTAP